LQRQAKVTIDFLYHLMPP